MTIAIPESCTHNIDASKQSKLLVSQSAILLDQNQALQARFKALFTLKQINTPSSIDIIISAFSTPSDLLKHELAYVLGQMANPYAIPFLKIVLEDRNQVAMVRHEAAEALGAIGGDEGLIKFLEGFEKDTAEIVEVRETCELAVEKIRFDNAKLENKSTGPYSSIDPAPPSETKCTTAEFGKTLMNTSKSLFERYQAMFALRNIGTLEAVKELANGFNDKSALFRHEIAYVFGQMQHAGSVESLVKRLEDPNELGMVRHECAEALGSIGTDDVLPVLQKYKEDVNVVVRESCLVGLDMWEFENSGDII